MRARGSRCCSTEPPSPLSALRCRGVRRHDRRIRGADPRRRHFVSDRCPGAPRGISLRGARESVDPGHRARVHRDRSVPRLLPAGFSHQIASLSLFADAIFASGAIALAFAAAVPRSPELDEAGHQELSDERRKSREIEYRYSLGLAAAHQGLWDWNFETDTLFLSPSVEALLGLEPGALNSSERKWAELIAPGRRAALRRLDERPSPPRQLVLHARNAHAPRQGRHALDSTARQLRRRRAAAKRSAASASSATSPAARRKNPNTRATRPATPSPASCCATRFLTRLDGVSGVHADRSNAPQRRGPRRRRRSLARRHRQHGPPGRRSVPVANRAQARSRGRTRRCRRTPGQRRVRGPGAWARAATKTAPRSPNASATR